MSSIKKLTQKRLFLPIFSMILVMLINVVYDIGNRRSAAWILHDLDQKRSAIRTTDRYPEPRK